MKPLDKLTYMSMAANAPDTWVSVLFDGATYWFGAHIGCAGKGEFARVVQLMTFDDEDIPVNHVRTCYYCCREMGTSFMKSATKLYAKPY